MKHYIHTFIGLLCLISSSLISNSPSTGVSATTENIDEENEFYLNDEVYDDDDEDGFVEFEDGVIENEDSINKREVDDEDEDMLSNLDELLGDNGVLSNINERQASRFIAPTKGFIGAPSPPPATINRPKKIKFDTTVNIDDEETFGPPGVQFRSGSVSDEDASDWSVVTPSGYEYEAQKTELRSIFAATASYSNGVSYSGTPVADDGPTKPNGPPGPPPARLRANRFQRSIYPPDTRKRVKNPNAFPWSAIGRFDNGCTGFFIGPRHILTAGHCVYNSVTKKYYKNLNFRRRKNCDPHGGTRYIWKYAITVKAWRKYGWESYNYAMVVVRTRSPVQLAIGWKKSMPRWIINIAGYPADKPNKCMWRSSCRIHRRYASMLGYRCDTYAGMSGGPVYVYWKNTNKRIVYGIHAYGKSSKHNYNRGVRITYPRFVQFKQWIKKY